MAVTTTASVSPAENGALFVTASFFDESTPPAAVTPTSITWTLTDAMKTIVNNRSQIAITPDDSITIVLKGDDLALDPAYVGTTRHLLLEWLYDSTLGDDIPGKAQLAFDIVDLTALPRS